MILIKNAFSGNLPKNPTIIIIKADRRTLSKRRWRGVADDGTEFGFDLQLSLTAGQYVYCDGDNCFQLEQNKEEVIRITKRMSPEESISLAWQIGNLHFPLQIEGGRLYTANDPAIQQMLERADISYTMEEKIFEPLISAGHGHGAHHHH